LSGDLKSRYYWYFANTIGDKIVWSGDDEPNSGPFCVTNKAFYYSNANQSDCEHKQFKRLDTGNNVVYTDTLIETRTSPYDAAIACRGKANNVQRDEFIDCWMRAVSSSKQRAILDCWKKMDSYASFAICANSESLDPRSYKVASCASKYLNEGKGASFITCAGNAALTPDQAKIFDCAVSNRGNYAAMTSCAVQSEMTDEQRRIANCVTSNASYKQMAICATGVFMTPEQSRVIGCVTGNRGQWTQMAVCAAGNTLTPEQQVFASCAISTGGQPYAFAGCVGTQLTLNELQKCIDRGIGGSGCFGQNNETVKFMRNAWKDVTEGPGPSNDLLGRDGFVGRTLENARRDVEQGPGSGNEVFGGQGFVGRTLEDVRKNAPPPVELGTVGGNRVCIPWC
jgi:Protein of unknown function (DUF1036)